MACPKHKRYVKEHLEFREEQSFNSILAIVLFDRSWNKHCPSISPLWRPSLPVVAVAAQTNMASRQLTPIHLGPRAYHHRELPIQQRIPLLLRGLGKYFSSKQTTNNGQTNKQCRHQIRIWFCWRLLHLLLSIVVNQLVWSQSMDWLFWQVRETKGDPLKWIGLDDVNLVLLNLGVYWGVPFHHHFYRSCILSVLYQWLSWPKTTATYSMSTRWLWEEPRRCVGVARSLWSSR